MSSKVPKGSMCRVLKFTSYLFANANIWQGGIFTWAVICIAYPTFINISSAISTAIGNQNIYRPCSLVGTTTASLRAGIPVAPCTPCTINFDYVEIKNNEEMSKLDIVGQELCDICSFLIILPGFRELSMYTVMAVGEFSKAPNKPIPLASWHAEFW